MKSQPNMWGAIKKPTAIDLSMEIKAFLQVFDRTVKKLCCFAGCFRITKVLVACQFDICNFSWGQKLTMDFFSKKIYDDQK